MAHNGMLYNDRYLRRKLHLPRTRIETDSYAAVQLLEQQGTLGFDSLRYMAEKVEGSFTFSVLDGNDHLYLVKGDNPLCLYYFTVHPVQDVQEFICFKIFAGNSHRQAVCAIVVIQIILFIVKI